MKNIARYETPEGWVKSSDRLPEENVSVLVFIPEEDNHITTGMWDVSKKWVLLDEYRVPTSQVTYWHPMIEAPADKEYIKSPHRPEEHDTMAFTISKLQKENYELEKALTSYKNKLREATNKKIEELKACYEVAPYDQKTQLLIAIWQHESFLRLIDEVKL